MAAQINVCDIGVQVCKCAKHMTYTVCTPCKIALFKKWRLHRVHRFSKTPADPKATSVTGAPHKHEVIYMFIFSIKFAKPRNASREAPSGPVARRRGLGVAIPLGNRKAPPPPPSAPGCLAKTGFLEHPKPAQTNSRSDLEPNRGSKDSPPPNQ